MLCSNQTIYKLICIYPIAIAVKGKIWIVVGLLLTANVSANGRPTTEMVFVDEPIAKGLLAGIVPCSRYGGLVKQRKPSTMLPRPTLERAFRLAMGPPSPTNTQGPSPLVRHTLACDATELIGVLSGSAADVEALFAVGEALQPLPRSPMIPSQQDIGQ